MDISLKPRNAAIIEVAGFKYYMFSDKLHIRVGL